MTKYFIYAIFVIIIISLICGGVHLLRVSIRNKKEMNQYFEKVEFNNQLGKVLIVYYSLSGNTKNIAEIIKNKTNADIYEIKTKENIKQNIFFYLKVRKQLKNEKYPELITDMPDVNKYDMIFVGSPVWWYTLSTPVLSFLEKTDFKNKKVAPFTTQGSNVGNSFEVFKNKAKDAIILQEASFNNLPEKYNKNVDNKISKWLNSL